MSNSAGGLTPPPPQAPTATPSPPPPPTGDESKAPRALCRFTLYLDVDGVLVCLFREALGHANARRPPNAKIIQERRRIRALRFQEHAHLPESKSQKKETEKTKHNLVGGFVLWFLDVHLKITRHCTAERQGDAVFFQQLEGVRSLKEATTARQHEGNVPRYYKTGWACFDIDKAGARFLYARITKTETAAAADTAAAAVFEKFRRLG